MKSVKIFNNSIKRQLYFEKFAGMHIDEEGTTKKSKLLGVCRPKGIQRYNAIEMFLGLLPCAVDAFD